MLPLPVQRYDMKSQNANQWQIFSKNAPCGIRQAASVFFRAPMTSTAKGQARQCAFSPYPKLHLTWRC